MTGDENQRRHHREKKDAMFHENPLSVSKK
jgi:hypothetical protein